MGCSINNFIWFIVAYLNGYLHDAMTLSIGSGIPKHTAIGIGMWLGVLWHLMFGLLFGLIKKEL